MGSQPSKSKIGSGITDKKTEPHGLQKALAIVQPHRNAKEEHQQLRKNSGTNQTKIQNLNVPAVKSQTDKKSTKNGSQSPPLQLMGIESITTVCDTSNQPELDADGHVLTLTYAENAPLAFQNTRNDRIMCMNIAHGGWL
jgi:hypothetical protein